MSSDGRSDAGPTPAEVYATLSFEGVTVNALIVAAQRNCRELLNWFEAEVLHGSGAFLILAESYEDCGRAVTIKLERELEMPLLCGLSLAGNGA